MVEKLLSVALQWCSCSCVFNKLTFFHDSGVPAHVFANKLMIFFKGQRCSRS